MGSLPNLLYPQKRICKGSAAAVAGGAGVGAVGVVIVVI